MSEWRLMGENKKRGYSRKVAGGGRKKKFIFSLNRLPRFNLFSQICFFLCGRIYFLSLHIITAWLSHVWGKLWIYVRLGGECELSEESVAKAIYTETENCENWQDEKSLSSAYAAWFYFIPTIKLKYSLRELHFNSETRNSWVKACFRLGRWVERMREGFRRCEKHINFPNGKTTKQCA